MSAKLDKDSYQQSCGGISFLGTMMHELVLEDAVLSVNLSSQRRHAIESSRSLGAVQASGRVRMGPCKSGDHLLRYGTVEENGLERTWKRSRERASDSNRCETSKAPNMETEHVSTPRLGMRWDYG